MNHAARIWLLAQVGVMAWGACAWAQTSGGDPQAVVENYSSQMITILKGPIAKVLSFIILLACAGALLRGRHGLAISCGLAFIVLLFLQVI